MKFESFEHALQVCMTTEEGSPEQLEAMNYCLKHAPADLRAMLEKRLSSDPDDSGHGGGCNCGCND